MSIFRGWGGAALVTGASGGIGLELARSLAERGFDLILVARSLGKLERIAMKLKVTHHVRVHVVKADLSEPDAAEHLMAELRTIDLDIDVLVNNAGFGIYGRFPARGPERETEMIRLNVMTPTGLVARLLPGMIRRRRGMILNVASTAGFAPVPFLGTYAGTKAFLLHWTLSLAEELEGTGVRAAVLCPGSTRTNFHAVSGAGERRPADALRQDASDVARECLRGLDRGKKVIVSGSVNRIHARVARLVPPAFAARLAWKWMRRRERRR
jgi:short-subunit dehydrogenase